MASKIPQCTGCGGSGHYAINCYVTARTVPQAKKRFIKPESDKAHQKRIDTRDEWFELNPPETDDSRWYCYLNGLSDHCWTYMAKDEIIIFGLEHVEPKVKSRAKKFDVDNLRVACPPCNTVKGSWSIDQLKQRHPTWPGPLLV